MSLRDRAAEILRRLKACYPVTGPFTIWNNVFELVIVTVLSAQCTDERVNMVSPKLFAKYPNARSLAKASIIDIERVIYSTGFYRAKSRNIKRIAQMIVVEYAGEVPGTFEDLIRFPGVSKKSACVILAKGFHVFHGVAVDTHVLRVAPRLGLTKAKSSASMSCDLETLYPSQEYLNVNEYLITHGRAVCKPRIPLCDSCVLRDVCPSAKQFSTNL